MAFFSLLLALPLPTGFGRGYPYTTTEVYLLKLIPLVAALSPLLLYGNMVYSLANLVTSG